MTPSMLRRRSTSSGVVERVPAATTRLAVEPAWESILDEVNAANVRGRGGDGFPAGSKWEFARAVPGKQKLTVANRDEP